MPSCSSFFIGSLGCSRSAGVFACSIRGAVGVELGPRPSAGTRPFSSDCLSESSASFGSGSSAASLAVRVRQPGLMRVRPRLREWLRAVLGGKCQCVHAVFGIRKLRSHSAGPDEVVELLLVAVCSGLACSRWFGRIAS